MLKTSVAEYLSGSRVLIDGPLLAELPLRLLLVVAEFALLFEFAFAFTFEFVFRTGDTKALAQLLRTAFANPEELRETGRRAFEQVETHSPERVVEATIEAIGKAVEKMRNEN